MRRTSTALAAAALALGLAGGLTACASDPDPSPSASGSAADAAALDEVTVEGDLGSEPTITLPSEPFTVSSVVGRLVADGDGAELSEGQLVSLNLKAVSGADGSELGSTYGEDPQTFTVGSTGVTALDSALPGSHVGARVLFALPATDAVPDGTQVYVADVVDTQDVPSRASGEPVAPVDGLPTVVLDDSGAPSVTLPTGEPPADLVAQPLIKGDGPEVESGQKVLVNYSLWLWGGDGEPFDSSWQSGRQPLSFTIGEQGIIQGWSEGLEGQPVGSQVLLVVPPDKGYGDEEYNGIPGGTTLVFVVDILAVL